jgi:hypothetical protein
MHVQRTHPFWHHCHTITRVRAGCDAPATSIAQSRYHGPNVLARLMMKSQAEDDEKRRAKERERERLVQAQARFAAD